MAVQEIERRSSTSATEQVGWRTRSYTEADCDDIRLFLANEYPESDVGLPEFFHWQCNQNPAGRPIIRVAYECQQNQIVGEIWGLPMGLQVGQEMQYATLIVNGVVRRDFRHKGLVTQIGRESFADALAQRGIEFTISIPSPASYKADTKYMYGVDLGRIPLLIKPLDWAALLTYKTGHPRLSRFAAAFLKQVVPPGARTVRSDAITLHKSECFDESFSELWERTRHKRPVAVVRDDAWLNWRYKEIPTRRYNVMIAQAGSEMIGYVVTRQTTLQGVSCGMIVDLWVEPTRRGRQAAYMLIQEVTGTFVSQGLQIAGALMLPGTEEYAALRQAGYWVCPRFLEPQPIPLCIRWHTETAPRYPLNDLSNWFFTMGDYDVI